MHTDLTCKYRVLIWYILCFSFLRLFFRNPVKNYIKLQWPLRLLVNSGSLEGLNFWWYRILRKACQLKKNTSVNSRVVFINQKHQAHLKKKKKKSSVHHSSAFKHCLCWVRKSFEVSRTHENNYQLSSCIIKKDQYLLRFSSRIPVQLEMTSSCVSVYFFLARGAMWKETYLRGVELKIKTWTDRLTLEWSWLE